jgi:hypothetical protein
MWKWLSPTPPTTPPNPPTTPQEYPTGTCVKTEKGVFWIKDSSRFRIKSQRVLDSWTFQVLPSTEAACAGYKVKGVLGFRDGTLIQNVADGKMYVIAGNKRRHIVSPDFFTRTLFDRGRVVEVSDEETNLHNDGEVLM